MRNGRKLALAMNTAGGTCLSKMSTSTEDLWHEDAYIPEQYVLSSPNFKVSLSTVQPDVPKLSEIVAHKSLPTRPVLGSAISSERPRSNLEFDCLLDPPRQFQSPVSPQSDSDEDNRSSYP